MRTRLLGGLGALLTAATAVVAFAPGLAAGPLADALAFFESQDPRRILLALGVAVGLYSAWSARPGTPDRPALDGPAAAFEGAGDPPETVTAADRARTGRALDERFERAVADDSASLASVRTVLAGTAEAAHARTADRTSAEAARAVETGAWTDDPVAAAFLAGEDGPGFSLWARLREWLDPAAERRRRVERTVAAVEDAFGDEAWNENSEGGEEA